MILHCTKHFNDSLTEEGEEPQQSVFTAAVPDAPAEPDPSTRPVSLTGSPPSGPAETDRAADADRQARAHTQRATVTVRQAALR